MIQPIQIMLEQGRYRDAVRFVLFHRAQGNLNFYVIAIFMAELIWDARAGERMAEDLNEQWQLGNKGMDNDWRYEGVK